MYGPAIPLPRYGIYAQIPECDVCKDIHQDIVCDGREFQALWVFITSETLRKYSGLISWNTNKQIGPELIYNDMNIYH